MTLLVKDNISWNKTCWKVTCIHPRYGARTQYTAIISDTSALLKQEGQDLLLALERTGTALFVTKGIEREIEEAQHHLGTGKADQRSRMNARTLVDRLHNNGRVLDIKTRGNGDNTAAFENYKVLYSLSHGLSKTVLHGMIVTDFEALYTGLSYLHDYYMERARRVGKTAFFVDIERTILLDSRFVEVSDSSLREMYGRVRTYFREKRALLPQRRREVLEEIASGFPGTFTYKKCLDLEAMEGRSRIPDTDYFFARAVMTILHRIQEGKQIEETRKLYQDSTRNTRSTDRKAVLAAYAFLPTLFPREATFGILTIDRDQSELLRLRKAAVVDYKHVQGYTP